jgi:hypothetical protein
MNTEDLITHVRARFDHETAKQTLREKYQAKMLFAYNEGLWSAGPELITVLSSIQVNESAVILDLYETPIKVNPKELLVLTIERWQEQMNAWLIEYNENQNKR